MTDFYTHEEDFDPAKLADEAVQSNLDPSIFEQIKDNDIQKPKNIIDWIRGSRFLNIKPFPKQVEICANFFGHFCPRCTDPGLLEQDRWGNQLLRIEVDYPLSELYDRSTFLEDGICPKCGANRLELLKAGELNHYLNLNGVAGMRCVAGDTVLFTASGIKTIKDIDPGHVEKGFVELGLDIAAKYGTRTASDHYYAGQAEAIKVELQYGLRLTGSFIHPVEVLDDNGVIRWKKLSELSAGDRIHVCPGADVWGDQENIGYSVPEPHYNALPVKIPSKWSTDLARFLGYLVSDGTYNSDYIIAFSVSDPAIRLDYIGLCQSLFGVTPQPRKPGETLEAGSSCEHLAFCSVEVRKFLRFIGLVDVTGRSKTIPKSLLGTRREIVLAFLGGLFLGDGGFYEEIGGKKVTITYTTVSEELATMLQQVLLNLGVLVTLGRCDSRHFNSNEKLGHDVFFMSTKTVEDGALLGSVIEPHLIGVKKETAFNISQARRDNHVQMPGSGPAARALIDTIRGDKPNLRFKEAKDVFALIGGATRIKGIKNGSDISRCLAVELLDATRDVFGHTEGFKWLQEIVDAPGRFLGIRKITRLSEPIDLYDLNVPDGHEFLANSIVSHNSSKTVIVGGLLSTYQLARYLLLKSPSKFFGLMENQTLHSTFVAITAGQAKDTLWQAFKDRIEAAPWFKEYHAFLTEESKRLGRDKFHDVKETFVSYDHKQLVCSYCGPDIRTIRGRTRFNTGIDEKGWFDVQAETSTSASTKVRMNAHETNTALVKSLRTIRSAAMKLRDSGIYDPPDAFNCDVSSPSSLNDAIMIGLREANEDSTIYPFHYSTWEMNPDVSLDSLRSEMRKRREFERDYAAVPPLGANQFIDNQPAIEKCQSGQGQNHKITWTKKYYTDDYGEKTIYLEVKPIKKDKTKPMILTVDTGLSNNSFAVELWSFDRELRKPVCEAALECMPEETETERVLVNFPLMFEHCIVPLVTNFRVIMAAYDRWNCVVGDTMVFTDDGIKQISEMSTDVPGIVPHQEFVATKEGRSQTSLWGRLPLDRELLKLTTVGGYTLTGTPDHKILSTADDGKPCWKKIGDMEKGDWVALRSPNMWPRKKYRIFFNERPPKVTCEICGESFGNLQNHVLSTHGVRLAEYRKKFKPLWTQSSTGGPVPKFPKYMTPSLASLVGYLSAEGWHGAEFSNKDKRVIDHYVSLYQECFGIQPGIFEQRTKDGKPFWRVLSSSVDVRRFLVSLGLDKTSSEKEIPQAILMSPKIVVRSYLSALFEGDGSASLSTRNKHQRVTIGLNSRQLIQQIQALLLNFGIFSVVGRSRKIHLLSMAAEDSAKFLRDIGFVFKNTTITATQPSEVIPSSSIIRSWISTKPDLSFLGGSYRHWLLYKAGNLKIHAYRKLKSKLRHRFPDLVTALDDLAQYTWRKVKQIDDIGFGPVYDVTVPGSGSFIANGIVSHNSIDQVQRLRKDYKVEAIQYVLKWVDFTAIRARVIDSGIVIPQMEIELSEVRKSDKKFEDMVRSVPVTHLVLQILTVREGGRKVMKPINGTDDLFRALCLAVRFIMDPEYTRKFEQYGSTMGLGRATVGVVRQNYGDQATSIARNRDGSHMGFRKGFVGTLK